MKLNLSALSNKSVLLIVVIQLFISCDKSVYYDNYYADVSMKFKNKSPFIVGEEIEVKIIIQNKNGDEYDYSWVDSEIKGSGITEVFANEEFTFTPLEAGYYRIQSRVHFNDGSLKIINDSVLVSWVGRYEIHASVRSKKNGELVKYRDNLLLNAYLFDLLSQDYIYDTTLYLDISENEWIEEVKKKSYPVKWSVPDQIPLTGDEITGGHEIFIVDDLIELSVIDLPVGSYEFIASGYFDDLELRDTVQVDIMNNSFLAWKDGFQITSFKAISSGDIFDDRAYYELSYFGELTNIGNLTAENIHLILIHDSNLLSVFSLDQIDQESSFVVNVTDTLIMPRESFPVFQFSYQLQYEDIESNGVKVGRINNW